VNVLHRGEGAGLSVVVVGKGVAAVVISLESNASLWNSGFVGRNPCVAPKTGKRSDTSLCV
jgi:hypothetical protein